ncbi:MAG: hypothetical protein ABSH53_15355 [Holophaga sp.]
MRPALALSAVLAGPGTQAAQPRPFSLEATTDLLYDRNLEATGPFSFQLPKPRPKQYQASLSLVAAQGPWTGGLTAWYVNFYQEDPNFTLDRPTATIHRKYLKFDAGPWALQAGDFNTMLGRGLLLSVVQNPPVLKLDTVYGGDARWRSGRLELHGLAGTVTLEDQTQSWRLVGAEASVEYLPGQRLGVAAGNAQDGRLSPFAVPVGLRQGRSVIASGRDPSGSLDYYLERGHLAYRDQQPPPWPLPVDPTQGDATYGNLSFHHRAWYQVRSNLGRVSPGSGRARRPGRGPPPKASTSSCTSSATIHA